MFRFTKSKDNKDAEARQIQDPSWSISRWTAAGYFCVGVTLFIVLGLEIWGAIHDLQLVRETFMESEMGRLRSHAMRSVIRIQDELHEFRGPVDIQAVRANRFLRRHWESVEKDESHLYAAIVDTAGNVVMHTDRTREGRKLSQTWYDHLVDSAGEDVVETRDDALVNGERALDVRVPIYYENQLLGNYHNGLDYAWLEKEMKTKQAETWTLWGWIFTGTVTIVLVAGVTLYNISRKVTVLHETMKMARVRRFAELGQLMAGIVHEIRNPLNAMRLNLHVLTRCNERLENGGGEDPSIDVRQIIAETTQEIERVEALMRILLGYARPDRPQNEILDVRQELQTTLGFLKPMLERAEVVVRARLPDEPTSIHMDRDRLRQIVLNLINNAKEATGPGGQIEIDVATLSDWVEISVTDDGPGVAPQDREKIFEPFFSTKELGTGLGLAIVRRFMDDVGGVVECRAQNPRGARFILRFPTTNSLQDAGAFPMKGLS